MSKNKLNDDAIDFEVSKSLLALKSEKRAWNITKGSCVLTFMSWTALVLLMPLKTVEPYLALTDSSTGRTELVTVLNSETISEAEALSDFWIANYIRWREVYDWYTLQNDYNMTVLFSTPQVANEYATIFDGENNIVDKWGKRVKASVKILSIVNSEEDSIATVRFQKTIQNIDDSTAAKPTNWVATLGYEYVNDELSETERLKNPLGFKITSYRVDPEIL